MVAQLKKLACSLLALFFSLVLIGASSRTHSQTRLPEQAQSIILYSPIKYNNKIAQTIRGSFQLRLTGAGPDVATGIPCLSFGSVYVGKELDWLMIHGKSNDRSVIRDLGEYNWKDSFTVPAVPALPELKPGEQRRLIINTPVEDPDSLRARSTMSGVTSARNHDSSIDDRSLQLPPPYPTVRKPTVISAQDLEASALVLTKALPKHMYVVHVVNSESDYYILVHVDAVVRGDHCRITWKRLSDSSSPRAPRQDVSRERTS